MHPACSSAQACFTQGATGDKWEPLKAYALSIGVPPSMVAAFAMNANTQ
jgi:hypothetical protein